VARRLCRYTVAQARACPDRGRKGRRHCMIGLRGSGI
jgi:hypothetical protein